MGITKIVKWPKNNWKYPKIELTTDIYSKIYTDNWQKALAIVIHLKFIENNFVVELLLV